MNIDKDSKLIVVHNTRIFVTNYGNLPSSLNTFLTEFNTFYRKGRQVKVPVWTAIHKTKHPLFGDIICVPRNISIKKLKSFFPDHTLIEDFNCHNPYTTVDITCSGNPRDDIQTEALDYLAGDGDYTTRRYFRQKNLFLQTGMGKTFITIKHIAEVKLMTMIVVHKDSLIGQWTDRITEFTDIKEDEIAIIKGNGSYKKILKNKDKYKIIIASNKTINSSLSDDTSITEFRTFVRDMKIGLKVIDEAQLGPKITFKLDSETNIYNTIYLTATPKRSKQSSDKIFKMILPDISNSFGSKQEHREDAYHNVVYAVISSNPGDEYMSSSVGGINISKYSDYVVTNTLSWMYDDIIKPTIQNNISHLKDNGFKLAIICGNLNLVTVLYSYIQEDFKDIVSVGNYTSMVDDKKAQVISNDVVVSTNCSMDAGDDFSFDIIINLVPLSSEVAIDQLMGRIRNKPNPLMKKLFIDISDI